MGSMDMSLSAIMLFSTDARVMCPLLSVSRMEKENLSFSCDLPRRAIERQMAKSSNVTTSAESDDDDDDDSNDKGVDVDVIVVDDSKGGDDDDDDCVVVVDGGTML